MELNERNIRRISVLILILVLAILVFLLIEPILLSIIGGLILAYTFFPVYRIVLRKVRAKNAAATIVSLLVILIILVPIYFFIPFMVNQVFEIFQSAKTLNIQTFIKAVFPSAPNSFIIQMTATFDSLVGKISSSVLNSLVSFLLDIPTILFNLLIVAFVFFYALRDSDRLGEFMSSLSPLNKLQEKKLVQQFKDITNSIVYGQIIVGIVQGLAAGLGFFVFGVPNALILTALAVILSIIPVLGPFFVWIPAAVYLFSLGNTLPATLFLLYNLILVSNVDNFLRLYLISKKADLSQVVVLIGMVGGLFIFGILGLILGPLILAYFITFLNAYRANTLSSLFSVEKE